MLLSFEENFLINILFKKKQFITNINVESEDINWEKIISLANTQKVFPLLYSEIKEFLPSEIKKKYYAIDKFRKIQIDHIIQQAEELSQRFDSEHISYAVIKGFTLSQLIYGDPYARAFGDIDFLVSEKDLVRACKIITQLGYTEKNIQKTIALSDFAIDYYFFSDQEKKFTKDYKALVELKTTISFVTTKEVEQALTNKRAYEINDHNFWSFSMSDIAILFIENIYENFFGEWGIISECSLRDIVDLYRFIHKYPMFFHEQYIQTLNEQHQKHLSNILFFLNVFLDEFGLTLPVNISSFAKENDQDVIKDLDLFTRIFDINERRNAHKWYTYLKETQGTQPTILRTYNIDYEPFDFEKGQMYTEYDIWQHQFLRNTLHSAFEFGTGYDDTNHLYLGLRIPKDFTDFLLEYHLIRSDARKEDLDHLEYYVNIIYIKENDIQLISNYEDTIEWSFNSCRKHNMLIIKIPIKCNIKFIIDNKTNYLFFFTIKPHLSAENYGENIAALFGSVYKPLRIIMNKK